MALAAKYGIISDVHANYTAMKMALDHLDAAGCDHIINLGDLVGYGAEPAKCVEAMRTRKNVTSIIGNHDRQAIGDKDDRMRKTAAKVLEWTAQHLTPEDVAYLKKIPQGLVLEEQFILVHGSLVERDAYLLSAPEIEKNLQAMIKDFPAAKVCFFGHTHVPMLIGTKRTMLELQETKMFKLDPNEKYMINPGSVGQPRDKCPLSSFGIFDTQNWTMTFIRKPYDYKQAQQLIIDNGLPEKFARRLALGI
ncbi:MAG TPA: metallophosphoesterase family protein [Planctomycetota bacterium]|nr:metallophosphoesterase family protein [Planctomycetota bacterium]